MARMKIPVFVAVLSAPGTPVSLDITESAGYVNMMEQEWYEGSVKDLIDAWRLR